MKSGLNHNHICLVWILWHSFNHDEKILAVLDFKKILVLLIRLIDLAKWIADASVGLIWRGLCVVLFIINLHTPNWTTLMILTQTHGMSKVTQTRKNYLEKTKETNKKPTHGLGCGPALSVESELNILYGLQLRNASLFLVSWSVSPSVLNIIWLKPL